MSGSGYIYANGRIRALEQTFVPVRMWQMLMSADDRKEFVKLLSDTWYGDLLAEREHVVEDALEDAMRITEDELIDMAEDEGLTSGILHRRDVRNARYLWKSGLLEEPEDPPATEREGLVPIEALRAALEQEDARENLPWQFRRTLEELVSTDGLTVRRADMLMDRLAAVVELGELPRFGGRLAHYSHMRIELLNMQTAGRCGMSKMTRDDVEELLLDGGLHSVEEVGRAYQSGDLDALLAESGASGAAEALREAVETSSFLAYERESERYLLSLLEDSSVYSVFGAEPLAALVIRREFEVRHLRILLAGKTAGVSQERILQRIPRG